MSPLAAAVDSLIRLYQARISPRKGWSCAHRVATGGPSCSAAVRTLVRDRGVVRAVVPSAAQLLLCYQAAGVLMAGEVRGVCCCGGIPIPFRF